MCIDNNDDRHIHTPPPPPTSSWYYAMFLFVCAMLWNGGQVERVGKCCMRLCMFESLSHYHYLASRQGAERRGLEPETSESRPSPPLQSRHNGGGRGCYRTRHTAIKYGHQTAKRERIEVQAHTHLVCFSINKAIVVDAALSLKSSIWTTEDEWW